VPIPADVCRARLVFDLGTGGQADEAVFGFHLHREHQAGNGTDWPDDVNEIAAGVRTRWENHTQAQNQWSSSVALRGVEVYHLDSATGHTLDKGLSGDDPASRWRGSSNNPSLPFEVATAVSLYAYTPGSFAQNARHRRGRFYLPPFQTGAMDSGANAGVYTVACQAAVSAQMSAFLNDIQGMHVGGGQGNPAGADSMSLVILSKPLNAVFQVEAVRVGQRPDSQRRRARSQVEGYLDTVLSHS